MFSRFTASNLGYVGIAVMNGYRGVFFDAFLAAFFTGSLAAFFEANRAVLFPVGFSAELRVRRMGCKSQGSGASSFAGCFSGRPEFFPVASCFNLRMSSRCSFAIMPK